MGKQRKLHAGGMTLVSALLVAACASSGPERARDLRVALPTTTRTTPLAGANDEGATAAKGGDSQALAQANNPLANMKALSFHDYYVPELSSIEGEANMFWVRYAQPISTGFGDWLVRASLPVSTVPDGPTDSDSGIGDGNVFAAYLLDSGNPSVSYGVGPFLGVPTGTRDEVGTGQWSAGAAAVLFDARSPTVQWGSLVTYQHKIAGSSRVDDVNLLAVQPFVFVQFGGGLYFRSTGICAFDLENSNYAVPVGFGLGKVVKAGKTVFNFFVEPQFTVLQEGPGQPELQLFVGFNTQFLGS